MVSDGLHARTHAPALAIVLEDPSGLEAGVHGRFIRPKPARCRHPWGFDGEGPAIGTKEGGPESGVSD